MKQDGQNVDRCWGGLMDTHLLSTSLCPRASGQSPYTQSLTRGLSCRNLSGGGGWGGALRQGREAGQRRGGTSEALLAAGAQWTPYLTVCAAWGQAALLEPSSQQLVAGCRQRAEGPGCCRSYSVSTRGQLWAAGRRARPPSDWDLGSPRSVYHGAHLTTSATSHGSPGVLTTVIRNALWNARESTAGGQHPRMSRGLQPDYTGPHSTHVTLWCGTQ